ncbi:hypothetical protein SIO70_22920 [Chitinophaga sancti]|nr:hypothetical protein [Chitinophaga sancti]WPQ61217.1 hypothetical protein SIO70_22920 [Chitinophaga sancti]
MISREQSLQLSDLSPGELYDLVNNQIKTRLAQLKGVGKVKGQTD